MRFFTTIEKAGRLEYFLVRVVLAAVTYALLHYVLEFRLVDTTLIDEPSISDMFSYSQGAIPPFLVGIAVVLFFVVVNAARRLKDMTKGQGLAVILLIPVIGTVFELYLLISKGEEQKTYAPYGDNPYDPQSYIAPPKANGGPSVSYRGEDLYLPGEGVVQAEPPIEGEAAA